MNTSTHGPHSKILILMCLQGKISTKPDGGFQATCVDSNHEAHDGYKAPLGSCGYSGDGSDVVFVVCETHACGCTPSIVFEKRAIIVGADVAAYDFACLGILWRCLHLMWQAFFDGFNIELRTSITDANVPAPEVYESFPGDLSSGLSLLL